MSLQHKKGRPPKKNSHLIFLETLDKIDRSLRKATDIDPMMTDFLDTVLNVFTSDGAWLLYPCDPGAPSWGVPMERTGKGYPGAFSIGADIPMLDEAKAVFQSALKSDKPIVYDQNSQRLLPARTAKQFTIRSQITVAIYPEPGSPWLFGMHQCSHPRIWTDDEQRLFHEIGRRVTHALSTQLLLDNLRKSEEKMAGQALGQSETYLRTLIHTIPDLVWLKDEQGIYLFCNSRFERFFGATEEQIKGKTDYDFVSKDLADIFRKHDKLAMAKGSPSINEEEVTYADDGHHEILETIKTPLYGNNGQLIGVLGIARDITDRKQAEEERKKLEDQLRQSHKMEAIGTISGGIAHDFNNILGIIIGNTELALGSIEEWNPVRSYLEEIKQAGLRASDVVKQLLNFSRKTEQSKKIIEISPIINGSINLLRASIPTSIDIHLDIPDRLKTIKADPTQIHQVLMNLCTNAAHSMEKNGGTLGIALSEVKLDNTTTTRFQEIDAGDYIQLTISDTGHGIDSKIKGKIFDPYFTTKSVGKGTGMGLAIVLGIIKNHNGAISVYSEQGKGSTFKILFPAVEGDTATEKIISQAIPKGDETILFIDDEDALVKIGRLILEWLGYTVKTRTNPLDALALFQSDPFQFDLIITDMTMPRLAGDKLISEVLKINPKMPVILCTGFSHKIDRQKALMIGAHSYLEKPLKIKRLALTVRKVLDNAQKK